MLDSFYLIVRENSLFYELKKIKSQSFSSIKVHIKMIKHFSMYLKCLKGIFLHKKGNYTIRNLIISGNDDKSFFSPV